MSPAVLQIKDKLNIVDVVSSYLKLEKAGVNWKARCPFHHEKTPSFFVSPARESFHCFGCNRGGDMFTFVQEIEGLDFMGALKILAERAGVVLEQTGFKRDPEQDKLYRLLEAARAYYERELPKAESVKKYLKDRGLKGETAKAFGLGWAPSSWQGLYDYLTKLDYQAADIERAGLIIHSTKPGSQSRYYDRFRGRIMFPLLDGSGRVVGFSGRIFSAEGGSASGGVIEPAKYVNGPETSVYSKSRLLFGFPQAKLEIKRKDACVLVEGQFDLVMSHQAGVTNVVAVSGTALTNYHLELIKRFTNNIIMAFDGDSAGFKAASRAIELGLELGLEMKVAELPSGQDPASVCQTNPELWQKAVGEARHVVDFLLNVIVAREPIGRRRAHLIKEGVYPYIARLQQRIDQAFFISQVASLTGLSEEVIRADLREQKLSQKVAPVQSETEIIFSRSDRILERLLGLHWWQKFDLPELIKTHETKFFSRQAELSLQAELIYSHLPPPDLLKEVASLIQSLEIELLLETRAAVTKELAKAKEDKVEEKEHQYLKKIDELTRKINDLKNK